MIGREYVLGPAKVPVTVLAAWSHDHVKRGRRVNRIRGGAVVVDRGEDAPRNVLIRLPDGRRVVRPFRGLRRP